jgi:hypothetical protein
VSDAIEERFWSKVRKSDGDGCWEWTGALTARRRGADGYGQFSADGRRGRAHRVSWEMANGPIPAGMYVCHRCDNPPCVNPAHLFLGTEKDNAADMARKGRSRNNPVLGERHFRAKLTAAGVLAIRARRAAGESDSAIAADIGISRPAVNRIGRGVSWAHVRDDTGDKP